MGVLMESSAVLPTIRTLISIDEFGIGIHEGQRLLGVAWYVKDLVGEHWERLGGS